MTATGLEIYGAFIEAELKIETDRRESVHSRAGTFATGSVALITLTLGVFGLLSGEHVAFPDHAKPTFITAVVCLLAGAAFAVWAIFPREQEFVKANTLADMLVLHHADDEHAARYGVASINSAALLSLRRGTHRKALWVFASGVAQIVAMFLIGLT